MLSLFASQNMRRQQTFLFGAYLLRRCARLWITKRGQNTQSHLFVLFHFQGGTFLPPFLATSAGRWERSSSRRERERVCEGVGGLIKSTASRTAHEAVSSALDPFLTPRILRRRMWVGEVCCCGWLGYARRLHSYSWIRISDPTSVFRWIDM